MAIVETSSPLQFYGIILGLLKLFESPLHPPPLFLKEIKIENSILSLSEYYRILGDGYY